MKKTALYRAIRRLWVIYKAVSLSSSYLNSTGFIKSHVHLQPIDQNGQPIPWMNYAMVKFLESRLTGDLTMFEYGSGFSTQYFAKRVKEITSLEYDRNWEKETVEMLEPFPNAHVIFKEIGEDYIHSAKASQKKYDAILIDGRERVACVASSFDALSDGGVIILDDSNRTEYQKAFEVATEHGFKHLTITGIKPFSFVEEATTIFYKQGNCLGI